MKILFVDACARKESRTRRMAERFLDGMKGDIVHLNLYEEDIRPLDEEDTVIREKMVAEGKNNLRLTGYARQFALADMIVFAAPYWDLSFPSILKVYMEAVNVSGITFRYSEEGYPISMCSAKTMVYLTSAGGPVIDDSFCFGYIESLCRNFYGISESYLVKAENLDVIGADTDGILEEAFEKIDEIGKKVVS